MLTLVFTALLSAPLQQQPPIERLARVATGPGVRDNPAALATASGVAVVWEEVRGGRYLLVQGGSDPSGAIAPPEVLLGKWGHQWGPSLAARGDTTWLACYMADASLRTGDRDVVVLRYRGRFAAPIDTIRITRDPPGVALPRNDASPVLLPGDSGQLIVAWSQGEFHENRPTRRAYDDKDILAVELDGAAPRVVRRLTTEKERGREMSPALAGHLLAYLSQAGHARYALKVGRFDAKWRLHSTRVVATSRGGIAHPSLLLLGGVVYLSWVDNATTDVVIARLDESLRVRSKQSLRQALRATTFSAYGPALASLSGARLFDDNGHLGVTFVATMEFQPAADRVRQEIFLATFR